LKNKEKEPQNDGQKDIAEVNHSQQLPRLRRIEGQVRGLHKMIETERDCLDITHQISAIINALRRVQSDMLHDHLAALGEAIIAEEISPKKRRELAAEIRDHLKRLS
jgi:DNA-binding FrmR family transcriptional regulator